MKPTQHHTQAVPDEFVPSGHTPGSGLTHEKFHATGQDSSTGHHPTSGLEPPPVETTQSFENIAKKGKTVLPDPSTTGEDKLKDPVLTNK